MESKKQEQEKKRAGEPKKGEKEMSPLHLKRNRTSIAGQWKGKNRTRKTIHVTHKKKGEKKRNEKDRVNELAPPCCGRKVNREKSMLKQKEAFRGQNKIPV